MEDWLMLKRKLSLLYGIIMMAMASFLLAGTAFGSNKIIQGQTSTGIHFDHAVAFMSMTPAQPFLGQAYAEIPSQIILGSYIGQPPIEGLIILGQTSFGGPRALFAKSTAADDYTELITVPAVCWKLRK